MRALVACFSLMLLGCTPARVPGLAFALPVVGDPAPPAPVQTQAPSATQESLRDGGVRIMGTARLPKALPAANVGADGAISGTPVIVTDVVSGRRVGMGTSFYDGSFFVDVPLARGERAVLVTLDVVDRDDSNRRATLAAPALLKASEQDHPMHVSLGTTVLAAVLGDVADMRTGRTLKEASFVLPIVANAEFGSLIAGFNQDDLPTFEAIVDKAPELAHPATVAELAAGLKSYVDRMRSSATQNPL